MLGATGVPRRLAEAVVEKAEGNPFFAEELARRSATGRTPPPSEIPDTINDVLMARIDRLPEETRRLLPDRLGDRPRVLAPIARAALGRAFLLDPNLAELARRSSSTSGRAPGPRLCLRACPDHEVAYDGLLVSTRRTLHEAVGRTLERQFAGRIDEVLDRLAHHYSRIGAERQGGGVPEPVRREGRPGLRPRRGHPASRRPYRTPSGSRRCPRAARARAGGAPGHLPVLPGPLRRGLDLLLRYQERVEALGNPRLAGEYSFWVGTSHVHMGDLRGAARNAAYRGGRRSVWGTAR